MKRTRLGFVMVAFLLLTATMIYFNTSFLKSMATFYDPPIVAEQTNDTEHLLRKIEELQSIIEGSERQIHDVCHPFPSILPPVTVQWRNNYKDIYGASLTAFGNGGQDWESWIALLMDHLPPTRLLNSVKNLPNMDHVRPIVKKLQARRNHFLQHGEIQISAPPPLKILVFGGSVTAGVLCRLNPLDDNIQVMRKRCSWTHRLEYLINTLLGYQAVIIINDALGGTDSNIGSMRVEYNLLPESMPDPDIIINSYSSNDMHILSMQQAEAKSMSLEDCVFEMVQDFIRAVEGPKECHRDGDEESTGPLLILLDDYLGNEQNGILDTMAFSSAMTRLTQYYQIMSISYADVVRDLVYADVTETWFTGFYFDENGEFQRQIHPPIGTHISIMWVIAFNMLNVLTVFCNEEAAVVRREPFLQRIMVKTNSDSISENNRVYMYKGEEGMPDIKMDTTLSKWPAELPPGLIPRLTPDLKLQNVSSLWLDSSSSYEARCEAKNNGDPCAFAWISDVNDIINVGNLNAKMDAVMEVNNGWEAQDDNGKLGFVPRTGVLGPSFTIRINNTPKAIQKINFLTMKSYGEDWMDSRVHIDVSSSHNIDDKLTEMEIEGIHASNTSVTYHHDLDLDAQYGVEDLRITFQLVGGSKFKFQGMAFCYQ